MTLIIHEDIISKLNNFIKNKKIPNLILHGAAGSGKKTLLFNFLKEVYKNEPNYMKNFVMILLNILYNLKISVLQLKVQVSIVSLY